MVGIANVLHTKDIKQFVHDIAGKISLMLHPLEAKIVSQLGGSYAIAAAFVKAHGEAQLEQVGSAMKAAVFSAWQAYKDEPSFQPLTNLEARTSAAGKAGLIAGAAEVRKIIKQDEAGLWDDLIHGLNAAKVTEVKANA